jgi:hypothetical protein
MECRVCSTPITDPEYDRIVYREDYPEILIGPYCPTCFPKIRICSGCQHPFVANQGIEYHSNGQWFCASCRETLVTCTDCGLLTHQHVQGTSICQDCFNKNNFICSCCNQKHHVHALVSDSLDKLKYPELFQKYPKLCGVCYDIEKNMYTAKAVRKCTNCSSIYTHFTDEHPYCKSCWDSFSSCDDCGHIGPTVSEYIVAKEGGDPAHRKICRTCLQTYRECKECGTFSKKLVKKRNPFNKVREVCTSCANGKDYCRGCFNLAHLNPSGYCVNCTSEYDSTCSCGNSKPYARSQCRSCRGEREVSNYSHKPHIHFNYFDLSDKIFFGFENEITFGDGRDGEDSRMLAIRHFYKVFNHSTLYLKSDSSITGYGFEVVSHPMTLDYFHKLPLDKLFYGKEENHKSCGLHVHVSRESFESQVHILKVLDFIYNNKTFTNKVAGRIAGHYNQNLEYAKHSEAVLKGKERDRYKRINLSNSKTIEFRMFAGCTDIFTLSYRIEYIHAVISWTAVAPIKNQGMKDFLAYVTQNQKLYRNLYNFLKVQGRIK